MPSRGRVVGEELCKDGLRHPLRHRRRRECSSEEQQCIRERDWARLVQLGGNIYFLIKLGFVTQNGLYRMGAQMRGETLEDFLKTRHAKGAR